MITKRNYRPETRSYYIYECGDEGCKHVLKMPHQVPKFVCKECSQKMITGDIDNSLTQGLLNRLKKNR